MHKPVTLSSFTAQVIAGLPFAPNHEQEIAIAKISEFILENDERGVFILKGYAGTGKTNLISAITKSLPNIKWRSVLLAPTGRAAKVISNYSQNQAQTIHKKIFRKEIVSDGSVHFSLAENLHKNTLFIVDEASMIGADSNNDTLLGSLLENLFEYIYSGHNCKLILVGDTAQLPPIGTDLSPALDKDYLSRVFYLNIRQFELTEVARQRLDSGILLNATTIRNTLFKENFHFPKLVCRKDFIRINGEELEDVLNSCVSNYGEENMIIITRSNKRANLFSQSFRNRIKLYEEDICAGDKIMIVKNNYYWLPGTGLEASFIANGDMADITKITKRESLYGFNFCDCKIKLNDSNELIVKLITDCLYTDDPSLNTERLTTLYQNVLADVQDEPVKGLRMAYLKNSPYFNALQVKFSYAITCHKSQGGQWPVVFIDQGYLKDEGLNENFARWFYTAITRATEKVYLVNFNDLFFN